MQHYSVKTSSHAWKAQRNRDYLSLPLPNAIYIQSDTSAVTKEFFPKCVLKPRATLQPASRQDLRRTGSGSPASRGPPHRLLPPKPTEITTTHDSMEQNSLVSPEAGFLDRGARQRPSSKASSIWLPKVRISERTYNQHNLLNLRRFCDRRTGHAGQDAWRQGSTKATSKQC